MKAPAFLLRLAAAAALLFAASAPSAAQFDPRASVIELEWPTADGYERCAGVITARRPGAVLAWTAAHCAEVPLSVVRFFGGPGVNGALVRVPMRLANADAAELVIPLSSARAKAVALAVAARTLPPLGSTLTVVGHPVFALRAPGAGRWTVTYARMGEAVANPQTGALEYEIYCGRCAPGDSGSGVFDDAGRLVGMLYGVTDIANVAGGRLPDGRYGLVVPAAALR